MSLTELMDDRDRLKDENERLREDYLEARDIIDRLTAELSALLDIIDKAKNNDVYGCYAIIQSCDTSNPMDNGCPECAKTKGLCIDCRLEQAEHDVLKAMNRVEELKKEKENAKF